MNTKPKRLRASAGGWSPGSDDGRPKNNKAKSHRTRQGSTVAPIKKKGKPIISHSAKRYKDMKEAIKKLENKGYFVENQFYGFGAELGANEYELSDRDGKTLIDHLSEAQVMQLSNIL